MQMTEYETTVVVRADISGDTVETMLDKVREVVRLQGGKMLAINHWGKRKLAYEIEKQTRGIYVNAHYLGANNLVAELERNLRISDIVLRYLTIRMAEKVSPQDRQEKEYVKPHYDSVETHEEEFVAAPSHAHDEDDEAEEGGDFDSADKEVKE
jgi:small subunit ribosomal protein S6